MLRRAYRTDFPRGFGIACLTALLPACLIRPADPAPVSASVPLVACMFAPYTAEPEPATQDRDTCVLPPGPSDLVLSLAAPVPAAPECARRPYDVLIVLGSPSNPDGTPSSANLERVDTALRAHCAGLGDRFIVTGGAVHNGFVEAEVLRDALLARGVPADRIELEPRARHTDENVYYATRIMQAHGWKTALLVSELGHLRFTAECDANCCVRLGRATLLDFGMSTPMPLLRYDLEPTEGLLNYQACEFLQRRFQCLNLSNRDACTGRFRLPPDA